MARMIVCAAVLAALSGTFCAAQDYAPAPAPAPAPEPAPKSPGEPVFTEMKLLRTAGLPSNGLQLTVTAEKLVLPEALGPIGQPLFVQPTALHVLFKNLSGQPIVLDAYNLTLSRLALIVVGPEKETVVVARRPLVVRTREALPIDFPQIEPGNTFVTMEKLQFPGDFNLLINCALYMPGEYKVQVVYSRPPAGAPQIGVWQGVVVSNTLSFRIVGPIPPERATPEKPPESAPPESAPQPAPEKPPQSAPQPTPTGPASSRTSS